MIHKITDEDSMNEDITIESAITVEIIVSGDSGSKLAEMEISGHKTKRPHMVGPSAHLYLYHNSSP